MDDFQVHEQLAEDQQGIQDHQADNQDLSEEKNRRETFSQHGPIGTRSRCSLQLRVPQRPASPIWPAAFRGAFCCSRPALPLPQPPVGGLFLQSPTRPKPLGSPPNPAVSHHSAWAGGFSGSSSRGRTRAGAVTSVQRGLSPLRKHLRPLRSGSLMTGQASSEAAAALTGTVSAHELGTAPSPP